MSTNSTLPDCADVTRFEVINHARTAQVSCAPGLGRSVVALGVSVEFLLGDDGRTLKVFLTDHAEGWTSPGPGWLPQPADRPVDV
jgi:hypothetical protein